MKNRLHLILLPLSILLAACADNDDATREITVNIQLCLPEDMAPASASTLGGKTITLSLGRQTLTAQTDSEGRATISGLVPDIYDVSCSWEMTAADYLLHTGRQLEGGTSCTVSGSLNNCLIKEDGQRLTLTTTLGVNQDLIISKIYFAGSTYEGTTRAYTAGQYLELYNQADIDIDASGLYLALTETDNPQAFTMQNLHDDYGDSLVVVKQVFRIPEGQVLPPGGTLLITNSAVDHSGVSQYEYSLADADIEAKDSRARIQNNPATPGLEMVYCSYSQMTYINFQTNGLMGVVLFRCDDSDPSAWQPVYGYGKTRGNMFLMLPKRYIIDGVECLNNKAATGPDATTKRLYSDIDAGYTFVTATSGKTGEVVYRKTARRTDDGRIVLQDTNNSSNDFQVSTTIKPREYDE